MKYFVASNRYFFILPDSVVSKIYKKEKKAIMMLYQPSSLILQDESPSHFFLSSIYWFCFCTVQTSRVSEYNNVIIPHFTLPAYGQYF